MANHRSSVPGRNIRLHALWRDAILATNEHKCICCGESEETTVIQAHHIVEYSMCPALGYDVKNGVILCCRCHAHNHSGRPDLSNVVRDAIRKNAADKVAYVAAHENDNCPDYSSKDVRDTIAKGLHALIPRDFITYQKLYDMQHRAEHSASMKAWYASHKDEKNEQTRKWYLAHKDRVKELSHAWYEAHKADVLARTRAYATERKEKYREYHRKYAAAHRDRINQSKREYRERVKAAKEKERAEAVRC